jgi:cell division protein FtsZ
MSLIEFEESNEYSAALKVVGVGGGGTNAVNSMVRNQIMGVEFIVANTDIQSLESSSCAHKVQLGSDLTRGLGAGSSPEVGQRAAEESEDEIRNMLDGADMVFITAGMGGGTGTGGAPTVSRIAREIGALTVGIVTKPFSFEGKRRMVQAEAGIRELKEAVDTLIVIPNQKLLSFVGKQTSFTSAFGVVDDVLKQAVCSISDLIIVPGLVNLDFADVKTIMGNMGKALMGSGIAAGENRAIEAAEKAISSPLLDEASVDGAQGILINVTGGEDMSLMEVNEAAMLIQKNAHDDAHIIFGSVIDNSMEGQMRVTVIATGFEKQAKQEQPKQMLLKKVVNTDVEEPMRMAVGDNSFQHLKGLASEIKEENPDSTSATVNFDIPTFLRKHAD